MDSNWGRGSVQLYELGALSRTPAADPTHHTGTCYLSKSIIYLSMLAIYR